MYKEMMGPAGLMMSDEPEVITNTAEEVTKLKSKLRVLKDAYRKLQQQFDTANKESASRVQELSHARTGAEEAVKVARAEAEQAKKDKLELEKKHEENVSSAVQSAVRDALISERNAKIGLEQQVQSLTTTLELLQRDREGLMAQLQTRAKSQEPVIPTVESLSVALEALQQTRDITFPEKVSLRTFNAMYVCCTNILLVKHPLVANRESVSTWETFTTQARGPKRYALITHMGRYVEVDKKGAVFAGKTADQKDVNSLEPGDKAEEFVVEYGPYADGSWISWQSVLTGKYLGADRKGNLLCKEDGTVSPWEWFHVEPVK